MFSVVIPVHNKGPLLAEALASVSTQIHQDFEVLVVDDASDDDGLTAIHAFPSLPIRCLHRSTPGPAGYAARNLGIREARGRWIAFLDADDLWFPEHLSTAAGWIARYPEAGVYCSGFEEHMGGAVKTISVPVSRCLAANAFLALYARSDLIHTNSLVIQRELLLACGGFPEWGARRGGDHALWFRCVLQGSPVILAGQVTSRYRRDHSEVVRDPMTMTGAHPVCRVAEDALTGRLRLPPTWGKQEEHWIRQLANRKALHWMLQRKRVGLLPPAARSLPYPADLSPRNQLRWLIVSRMPVVWLRALYAVQAWRQAIRQRLC